LRIVRCLHRDLVLRAKAEGVNLNKFAVAALAVAVEWSPSSGGNGNGNGLGVNAADGGIPEDETEYPKPAALVEAERASLRRQIGLP
jgi:hypothetical protein